MTYASNRAALLPYFTHAIVTETGEVMGQGDPVAGIKLWTPLRPGAVFSIVPLAALMAFLAALPAHAAKVAPPLAVQATPANVAATLTAAPCGAVVALDPTAAYPANLTIVRPVDCSAAPLVIAAGGATIDTWAFPRVRGLKITGAKAVNHFNGVGYTAALTFTGSPNPDGSPAWDCGAISIVGGSVTGPFKAIPGQPFVPGDGLGVSFMRCSDVAVSLVKFTGLNHALTFGVSRRVSATGNDFTFMRSDGIDGGLVWGATISRNTFSATLITGAEHPDGAQFWSALTYPNSKTPAPYTTDILVSGNLCLGQMQCIGFTDHATGGFGKVTIENNVVANGGGGAILVGAARDLTLTNNDVRTTAGATYLANINAATRNTVTRRCGNVVADGGGKKGSTDAPC